LSTPSAKIIIKKLLFIKGEFSAFLNLTLPRHACSIYTIPVSIQQSYNFIISYTENRIYPGRVLSLFTPVLRVRCAPKLASGEIGPPSTRRPGSLKAGANVLSAPPIPLSRFARCCYRRYASRSPGTTTLPPSYFHPYMLVPHKRHGSLK